MCHNLKRSIIPCDNSHIEEYGAQATQHTNVDIKLYLFAREMRNPWNVVLFIFILFNFYFFVSTHEYTFLLED